MPASLWAKSTMMTLAPRRNRFSRPGDLAASGRKSSRPSRTWAIGRPEAARAAGRRQRVRDVVAGQPADRDRDPPDLGDVRLVRPVRLDQPAAPDEVRPATALDVPPDDRRAAVGQEREVRDVRPDPPRDRRHVRIVAVEDDPAIGLRDPADRRLDLGQLGQRVDALQVEVIGGHVRQHARVVRLVADAAQDHPATRGLEHGHVEVAPGEDLLGAARAGPVAGLDHPLVDEDAVRGGRADPPARPAAGCAT